MKRQLFFALFCILLGAGALLAQQAFYGSIIGSVTDPTGAVVPGASVTVTNVATGVDIELKTGPQGLYQVVNLKTGTYKVTVKVQGFQTFLRDNIKLEAAQLVRIDAALVVGDIAQTIEVTAVSPMINTDTATTTLVGVFEHKQTVTLPSGGTGYQVFPDIYYQLVYAHADVQNYAFTIGGSLSSSNAEVQDGMRVEGQRHYVGGNRGLARPGIESVEEVVIITSNPSAKYPNAAAIETVMRSGSNDWHGSAMYIHGNKALNASGYYSHLKSPWILHQYFGSIGGPIRKNKTFFFFGQQGFYHPNGEESFSNFPTAKMRAGDLSELIDPNFMRGTTRYVINDPLTGQPFPNNVIPAARIDPVAKKYLEMYPATNRATDTASGPLYQRNYLLTDLLIRKEKFNLDSRVDHYFTPREHTYVRFSLFDSPNARTQYNFPNFGGNFFIIKTKTMTAHHTSTITPNLINHAMLGIFNENDPLGGGDFRKAEDEPAWNKQLGIAGIPDNQDKGLPYVTLPQSGITTPYSYAFGNYKNRYTHFRDDATWIRGRHNLQFGFDLRHESEGSDMPGYGQMAAGNCMYGCLSFNGRWTGLDFADFLLGLPFEASRFIVLPPDSRKRNEWGFYFQDDIKWTPKLTVNLGLRYDYFSIVKSDHDFMTIFDPVSKRLVFPSDRAIQAVAPTVFTPVPLVTAKAAGYPDTLLLPDKNDWGPRVGLAYRFMANSVVRAGLGVYHTPLSFSSRRLITGPFQPFETFPAAQPGPSDPPVLKMANPYTGAARGTSLISFYGGEKDLKNPLHYNYNLAVEHQIGAHAFTAEFVGKHSILSWLPALNVVPPSLTPYSADRRPFPTLGSIQGQANGAHYKYHALRLQARRRFSQGLFFDVAYNWARAMDDASCSGDSCGGGENPFDRRPERGSVNGYYLPIHRMTVNYVYQLPFGSKGSRFSLADSGAGKAINFLIQGWETAGTYNFNSGYPLTVSTTYRNAAGQAYDAPNTNRFSGRADCTGQSYEPTADQKAQGYVFNPNAFSNRIPAGRLGSCSRASLPFGQATIGLNQSFFRNFKIPRWFVGDQGVNLRIGFLFFNAINHSINQNPVTSMDSALFAKRSNLKTGGDYSGFMRTITFQARLEF